ncbi:MAG: chemotaxis protein CheW [Bacteroidales bacterium]|nr:chemotaxis protein CheW [Bacteroidales bacterium]HOK97821.1 chemotaxis protein CheW [Bacteroidales bacterium]HPO64563.1 chemotaxis protein CheW [Bacteroidales bacterium]
MSNNKQHKINSYLTFKLGEETFAANVSKVLNILEMTKVTKVPKAPPYMKGVINLRGAVLPLVDTRIKFEMTPTEFTPNTCILVLDININGESVHVGALVDSVQEVIELDDSQIMPPPSIGTRYKSEFLEGVAKIGDDFVMILDMDLIFSTDELSLLKESVNEEQQQEQGNVG